MKRSRVRQGTTTTAYGFHGMSNLRETKGFFVDQGMLTTPNMLLNADIYDDGVIRKRTGYAKKINLSNCHSLWAGSIMLCVADGADGTPSLYIIRGDKATEIASITDPNQCRMHYIEYQDLIYMCNGHWSGVFVVGANTIRKWGFATPPTPKVYPVAGDLPPGTYSICYTYYDGDRMGGSGEVVTIKWEGGMAGIGLQDRPASTLVWITQVDGSDFFLADATGDMITNPNMAVPLPSFRVMEPPLLQNMQFGHGRLWGSVGNTVYYSEPARFEWFKEKNTFTFEDTVTIVAPYLNGVYVSTLAKTWLLEGTDVSKMVKKEVGDGGIPGTFCYALVEGRGFEISKEYSQIPTPIWVSKTGICTGTQSGRVVHLTEKTLKINVLQQGASIQRWRDGHPQLLISLFGDAIGERDSDLSKVFNDGKLFNY